MFDSWAPVKRQRDGLPSPFIVFLLSLPESFILVKGTREIWEGMHLIELRAIRHKSCQKEICDAQARFLPSTMMLGQAGSGAVLWALHYTAGHWIWPTQWWAHPGPPTSCFFLIPTCYVCLMSSAPVHCRFLSCESTSVTHSTWNSAMRKSVLRQWLLNT